MKLSDNPQAADEVDRLLRNWGRWCRVPKVYLNKTGKWAYRWLWFTEQPMFRLYRASRNRITKAQPPISLTDAERANDAFIRIANPELQTVLAEFYAVGHPHVVIAKIIGGSVRTSERRLAAAKQEFFNEYRKK